MFRSALAAASAAAALAAAPGLCAATLTLENVVSHAQAKDAVGVVSPPGDGRTFVLEQRSGIVRQFDPETGTIAEDPFLVVPDIGSGWEQGLHAVAFAPDFAQSGHVYASYVDSANVQRVVRYTVDSANPGRADPASAETVIEIEHTGPQHYGGWIEFGPKDGLLYMSVGESGSGLNAQTAQDPDTPFGSILRLDVGSDAFPDDGSRNYAIPDGNPFAGSVDGAPEVFAFGLRNAWRGGFDAETGDLYIADVGEDMREEVNIGLAGANYGWPLFEGTAETVSDAILAETGVLTAPIYEYLHGDGPFEGDSITGGFVYRGEGELGDALDGRYLFADLRGSVFTLTFDGETATDVLRWDLLLEDGTVPSLSTIVAFGMGAEGDLYLVDLFGGVFRVTGAEVPLPGAWLFGLTGLAVLRLRNRRRP